MVTYIHKESLSIIIIKLTTTLSRNCRTVLTKRKLIFSYLSHFISSPSFSGLLSMASKKFFNARANYIYPTLGSGNNTITAHDKVFEFDEDDVYNSSVVSSLESRKTIPSSRSSKKAPRKVEMAKDLAPVTCASLPVNIPDWSKIYSDHRRKENENSIYQLDDDSDHDDDDDLDGRVPPHEYLARRRGASFSVHEGIGRTLKGRDLRQVRNAVWERVGFED